MMCISPRQARSCQACHCATSARNCLPWVRPCCCREYSRPNRISMAPTAVKRSRREIGAEGCPSVPYWPLSNTVAAKPPEFAVWRGWNSDAATTRHRGPERHDAQAQEGGHRRLGDWPDADVSEESLSRIGRVGGIILYLVIASERAALAYARTTGANSKTELRMPLVENWSASLPSPAWKYCNPRGDQIAGIVTHYACSTERIRRVLRCFQ